MNELIAMMVIEIKYKHHNKENYFVEKVNNTPYGSF